MDLNQFLAFNHNPVANNTPVPPSSAPQIGLQNVVEHPLHLHQDSPEPPPSAPPPAKVAKRTRTSCQDPKKFTCDICNHASKTQGGLKIHMDSVHLLKRFKCEFCDYSATQKGNLKTHIQNIHEKKKYECSQCGFQAASRGSLKNHFDEVHLLKLHECKQCDFKCSQKTAFKNHMKQVHAHLNFKCDECSFKGANATVLYTHIRTAHLGEDFSCGNCDFKCRYRGSLIAHMQKKHEDRSFKCPSCDFVATDNVILASHKSKKHPNKQGCEPNHDNKCDECGHTFYKKSDLVRHRLAKHNNVRFDCQFCKTRTYTDRQLKRHIVRSHPNKLTDEDHDDPEMQKIMLDIEERESWAKATTQSRAKKRCDLCDYTSKYFYSVCYHRYNQHPKEMYEKDLKRFRRKEKRKRDGYPSDEDDDFFDDLQDSNPDDDLEGGFDFDELEFPEYDTAPRTRVQIRNGRKVVKVPLEIDRERVKNEHFIVKDVFQEVYEDGTDTSYDSDTSIDLQIEFIEVGP